MDCLLGTLCHCVLILYVWFRFVGGYRQAGRHNPNMHPHQHRPRTTPPAGTSTTASQPTRQLNMLHPPPLTLPPAFTAPAGHLHAPAASVAVQLVRLLVLLVLRLLFLLLVALTASLVVAGRPGEAGRAAAGGKQCSEGW